MELLWECSRGGKRPRFELRDNDAYWRPVVGYIRMVAPKRKKWEVVCLVGNNHKILCHLTHLCLRDAMAVAKVLLQGAAYGDE